MPQPIPYVIDFDGLTMNASQANDKILPPQMCEVKNIEIARQGRLKKTYGYDNMSTNESPNVTGEQRINAISPNIVGSLGNATDSYQVVIAGAQFYYQTVSTAAWVAATAISPGEIIPWNLAWGINASSEPVSYFAEESKGVFAVEAVGGTAVKYGASAPWTIAGSVEFFLDKLFVGKPTVGGTIEADRIYWSETGDDNGWSLAGGSGNLSLRDPGGGTAAISVGITGMRVYNKSLYIAGANNMFRLTGTTSATFGVERVVDVDFVNGATMYVSGGLLWYVDALGIWACNGRSSKNVMTDGMRDEWNKLSQANDIRLATASWDDSEGIYRIFFPTVREQWNYHYRDNRWSIRVYTGDDPMRVIGPPCNIFQGTAPNYSLGADSNGRVFNVNDTVDTDDTNTITGEATTGHIRLGELRGMVGAHARLQYMDIEAIRQEDKGGSSAGIFKVDIYIDGVIQYVFGSPGGAGLVAEAIDSSETTITVDASHGLTAPFVMKIDDEQMHCTSVSTNDFTVARGYNETTVASHSDNTPYTYATETASLTIVESPATDNFPTHYDGKSKARIDLGEINKTGRFFSFRFWDDDANSRFDVRRVTVWYEELNNAGSRPA